MLNARPALLAIMKWTPFCLLAAFIVLSSPTAARTEEAPKGIRTTNLRIAPHWSDADHMWFRRQSAEGGSETVRVNALTGEMIVQSGEVPSNEGVAEFSGGPVPRSGPSDGSTEVEFLNETEAAVQLLWIDPGGSRKAYRKVAAGKSIRQHTYFGHAWMALGDDGSFYGSTIVEPGSRQIRIHKSFPKPPERGRREAAQADIDSPWQLRIHQGELQYRVVRPEETLNEDNERTQSASADAWVSVESVNRLVTAEESLERPQVSPDGRIVVVWKKTPGENRPVFTIESSPADGGRAKLRERIYPLPGDRLDAWELVVVDTATWERLPTELPVIDFGRPNVRWRDGHELVIEKIDRGHQRFRLFVVDPIAGTIRTPIDESTDTFLWTAHGPVVRLINYLQDSDQVIYSSEQSGYRHLYLVDLSEQQPIGPITQGDFLVREIVQIDEASQCIWMYVGEYHDHQDPYHRHLARVDFDGSEFRVLTDCDGDHEVQFSPNRSYFVDTCSRVDQPPVHELRSAETGELISTLATAERHVPAGMTAHLPKVFSAKGRDGTTDIWGFICFPDDYDPQSDRVYPVIENIYAGPHDSHVPKQYRNAGWYQEWTSLGFIVVRIDGMGTANRSKAFHDVCWHNLKDAGFPDRIAWMNAAAKAYPAMDIERVGVYGTSAGGQNACGALLFHGDFYKAAVASCGCHDNRMDKASWNEQWMGYPVGDHYAESSNIENAAKLEGDLLLLVGELDDNVPPESTLRLVDALIRANKPFDFLMIPGMGHSDGGSYGRQRTRDFFVEKLRPEKPVSRNRVAAKSARP